MNSPDPDQLNPDATAESSLDAALHARLVANLELVEASLDEAYNDVENRFDEINRREKELDQRTRQIAVRESKTRLQRRRIAEELRAKRAELQNAPPSTGGAASDSETLNGLQRAHDELQRELRLQRDLADEAMREASIMREQLVEARPDEDMIHQLRDELQRLMAERDEAREALETFEEALRNQPANDQALEDQGRLTEELDRLEGENQSLVSEVDALREEIEELRNAPVGAGSNEAADLANGFDWETQKKLLLENLDEPTGNRLQTEIQSLERAAEVATTGMAADESEVRDLRDQINLLLAALASASDGNTAGIDYVAALEEEREKLETLQQQWHDKLRESELEISVERAKLARERVKLEEELREIEAERSRGAKPAEDEAAEPATRNKWLARLGLADDT